MSAFYNVDQPPFNMSSAARAIAAANNGLLFDIGDMSTLFQDAAGTIPVTAVEQPIGKILDKSGNGNHATQSVTASRPTLSARYNLYTKTNPDAAVPAGFTVGFGSGTFTHNLIDWTGPVLTNHKAVEQIQTVSGRSFLQYAITLQANTTYTLSAYFDKANSFITSGTDVVMFITDFNLATGETNKTLSSADSNGRISLTFTTATDGVGTLKIGCGCAGVMTGKLVFSGWQIVSGTTSCPYQRVNTATDYDTNPAMFPKYLKWDSVDDYLNLPFMNLYGGGAASIIAARDAVSQATDTYIISERSTSNANPKYFPSRQLAGGGNMDSYISDDTAAVVLDTIGSAFSGASDKVIRSVVDTGNNIKLFKNGVLAADDNYTRAGTLTLNNTTIGASVSTTTGSYASMKLYGLIITKSALTDAQRIKCERFLARKAGVML